MIKIYLTKWSKKRRNGWEGEGMFIFKAPKKKYIQKSASKDGQEVLDRLNAYLDGNADEPAKFLVNFWKDQGNAFSYKEIREAMLEGTVSEETMRLWQQDYTKMVADKMYPVWLNAITAGAKGQPIFDELPPGFSFNTGVPNVVSWIATRGSRFITAVIEEQRRAVNALLLKRVADKFTVDELARVIRPCIGLTAKQTKANVGYYRSIKERLAKEHPRMKKESIERKAREKQLIYAAKQQRERAYTIAHTEMAFAFNKGMDATIRQAQAEGLMGGMEKRWITAGVDNVCSICQALDGTQVGMDEEFGFPGKVLFPGHKLTPPAHPRCRCAVQYVEVEAPVWDTAGNDMKSYGTGEFNAMAEEEPIVWPERGEKISRDDYKEVMAYAREKGIEMQGVKNFDGSPQTLIDLIDDANSVAQFYPAIKEGKKKLRIRSDNMMDNEDFAITRGHIISINANAFKNVQRLEEEYRHLEQSGWFARGTNYHSIIKHEIGHVVANTYGIDGLEIAKRITGMSSLPKLMRYLETTVSQYAGAYSDGTEIISECFSSMYGSEIKPDFVLKFMDECSKII